MIKYLTFLLSFLFCSLSFAVTPNDCYLVAREAQARMDKIQVPSKILAFQVEVLENSLPVVKGHAMLAISSRDGLVLYDASGALVLKDVTFDSPAKVIFTKYIENVAKNQIILKSDAVWLN